MLPYVDDLVDSLYFTSLCISHFVCLLRSKKPPVLFLVFELFEIKEKLKKWRIFLVFIFKLNPDPAATLHLGVKTTYAP